MAFVERPQTSSLVIYPLSSSTSRHALQIFSNLMSSCVGPNGRNHIVRNTCGGHMTITSTCSRLLSTISISRSELKLVTSAITGHLQQFEDCGLFMAHMCLELTKAVLELDIHHSRVLSTFKTFITILVDYIKSDDCDICIKADFTSIKFLLAYVQSVISSKSLLNIRPKVLYDLSLVILNAFVNAIPSESVQRYSSGVFVLGQEGQPIRNCKSVNGLMLDFPELPPFGDPKDITFNTQYEVNKLGENVHYISVALVTCSMSGDVEGILDATYEGTEENFNDMDECVFEKMALLCSILEKNNVGLLLCQKVIHPRVKVLLKSKSIVFMDRLGSQTIPFIRDLTGCQPISSILQNIEKGDYAGKLTSATACIENGKSYIHLQKTNASVMTLVVCAEWEERLSELKHCVNACFKGLNSLAKEPYLLKGGGCWQMQCSYILKEKVMSTLPDMSTKLSCPEITIRQLLKVFRSCLHRWCLNLKHPLEHLSFDSSSMHCWRISKNVPSSLADDKHKPCCCGFKSMSLDSLNNLDITKDETSLIDTTNTISHASDKETKDDDFIVLDSFAACIEALHKGVLTAGLLLSVGQYICDKN